MMGVETFKKQLFLKVLQLLNIAILLLVKQFV